MDTHRPLLPRTHTRSSALGRQELHASCQTIMSPGTSSLSGRSHGYVLQASAHVELRTLTYVCLPFRQGGGPIMNDSDTPVSFLFGGLVPRRDPTASSEAATDSVGEGVRVEPRGLPPPRLKSPPPRQYRVKHRASSETPFEYDPANIVEIFGAKWVTTKDGDIRRLDAVECPPIPTTRMPLPKRELVKPILGVSKPSRGRHVPTRDTAGPNRKHVCTVEGCGKMFTKRAHLSRHIESLHRHERSMSLKARP